MAFVCVRLHTRAILEPAHNAYCFGASARSRLRCHTIPQGRGGAGMPAKRTSQTGRSLNTLRYITAKPVRGKHPYGSARRPIQSGGVNRHRPFSPCIRPHQHVPRDHSMVACQTNKPNPPGGGRPGQWEWRLREAAALSGAADEGLCGGGQGPERTMTKRVSMANGSGAKVTIVRNEIYNWENLVEPFLVHTLLGPRPPVRAPPLPPLWNTPPPPFVTIVPLV